ncbi:MAG: CHASE2 domain-containing protein, partial [Bdellovibrionales bacterium]
MQRALIHPITRSIILLMVLTGLIYSVSGLTGIKDRISNIVFETYMKAKPRESSGQIVFVDINDRSLAKIGQWPWSRNKTAQMIASIDEAGAAVIIFDGVIAEPDRHSPKNIAKYLRDDHPALEALQSMADNDDILAQTIENTDKFVAGFTRGSNSKAPILKKRILIKSDAKEFFIERSRTSFKKTSQFLPVLQKAAA